MAAKTEMLKCELDSKQMKVVMWHSLRQGDEWSKLADSFSLEFDVGLLPEAIASQCLLYGVRAKLQDSCSDFRKHGIAAYLDGMRSMFDEVLTQGQWNRKVTRGPSVDLALVQVVARKKKMPIATAESALKKLEKEQREQLMKKFAKEIATERKKITEASETDLTDLL